MPRSTSLLRPPLLLVLCLTLVALYWGAHTQWYSTTAMGIVPVLDGKENCLLAIDLSHGKLPPEPFYRAPLYPIVLAFALKLGSSEETLPLIARLVNGTAHLISTALIFYMALHLWQRKRSATLAALLFGLNPVLLFFASDPLDITLAISFMLGGLTLALKTIDRQCEEPAKFALYTGILLGLAGLTRSHFLTLACAWPILALGFSRRLSPLIAGLAGPIIGLGALALLNLICCNQAVLLPTQGAFNLWASNKPGANGKYFQQTISIQNNGHHQNPARIESEFLYYQATGAQGPVTIQTINTFWRKQTWSLLQQHTRALIKGLLRKSLYLIRNDEYYNNKTFWVHKELSPVLTWNPICWSLLLLLGTWGLIAHLPRRDLTFLTVCAALFALGVLLFYVSARFRVPLTAFLALFSGGILTLSKNTAKKAMLWIGGVVAISITSLSLIPITQAQQGSTEAEDYLLIAQANAELGRDSEAYTWAIRAHEIAPDRAAIIEILVTSFYNELIKNLPEFPPQDAIESSLLLSIRILPTHQKIAYITGVYLWILGDPKGAIHFWRSLAQKGGPESQDALSALLLTHKLSPREREYIRHIPTREKSTMLLLAESMQGSAAATQRLQELLPPEAITLEQKRLEWLFKGQ